MTSNVLYGVQLHSCGQICYFSAGSWPSLTPGAKVIIPIDKGETLAEIVSVTSARGLSEAPLSGELEYASPPSVAPHSPLPCGFLEDGVEKAHGLPLPAPKLSDVPDDTPGEPLAQTPDGLATTDIESATNKTAEFLPEPNHAHDENQIPKELAGAPVKTIFAGELYQWENWNETGDSEFSLQENEPEANSLCFDPSAENILPILRPATAEDLAKHTENRKAAKEARAFCVQRAKHHRLDMKVVMADLLLDGSKIIFYFTAPSRIDFRELVKDLVKEYRSRIELRQIGVRHETQMVGAIGNCGMVCCCRRYMRKFAPVTIKMAKEQNLFLNPTKISGTCGRLLCCLAFEQEAYEEFHKGCPKIGKKYNTNRGSVKVLRASIFRNTLSLLPEEGDEFEVAIDEWQAMEASRQGQAQQQAQQQNRAQQNGQNSRGDAKKPKNRPQDAGKNKAEATEAAREQEAADLSKDRPPYDRPRHKQRQQEMNANGPRNAREMQGEGERQEKQNEPATTERNNFSANAGFRRQAEPPDTKIGLSRFLAAAGGAPDEIGEAGEHGEIDELGKSKNTDELGNGHAED